MRTAQPRHGGPDDDAKTQTTTRWAERQRVGPNDKTAGSTTLRRARRRHSGPDGNVKDPTMTRWTRRRRQGPNDATAGSTTRRQAQRQHEGPKDDTGGPMTTPRAARRAQRQHEGPNAPVGSAIPLASGKTWVPRERRRGFRAEPPSPTFFYMYFLLWFMNLMAKIRYKRLDQKRDVRSR